MVAGTAGAWVVEEPWAVVGTMEGVGAGSSGGSVGTRRRVK